MLGATTVRPAPVAAAAVDPRAAGATWHLLQRETVNRLTALVGRRRLDRRMVAQDIVRGRTTHIALYGEAIADAAKHGADPVAVRAAGERIAGWFRSLVCGVCCSCLEAWDRETREQVEADLAQRRAISSQDPAMVLRAIEETDEHIAAAQQLRDALAARLATLTGGAR